MSDALQVSDAEVSLLGAAMAGYPDIDELASIVEASDFYSPLHEDIWAAILRVHRAGNRPDVVSVRLALTASEVKYDPIRLFEMTQLAPALAQAPFYAEKVAEATGLRRIQSAGVKLQQLGGKSGDLADTRELARQTVDEATRSSTPSRARTLADILPAVIDTAENGQTSVLGTGWPDIDRLIQGLAPGRLVVIGARPGVGKSVMGTNLALHFAKVHQHAVLLASLEMPESEVGQRLLAAHAGVGLTGLQMGTVDERGWRDIARHTSSLQSLPITIDDAPTQTVTGMRRAARDIQRHRDDLALIVVDYLQLVRPSDTRVNRSEQIAEISRGLKLLARETGACVVAMAQLNREGAKHSDGKPRMTDLRESGAIEADADQVLLLHQPDDDVPEIEVIVDKNRWGPKGVATLAMQGHYARLVAPVWHPSGAIA